MFEITVDKLWIFFPDRCLFRWSIIVSSFSLWLMRYISSASSLGSGESEGKGALQLNFIFDDLKFVFRIHGDWHFSLRSICPLWFTDVFSHDLQTTKIANLSFAVPLKRLSVLVIVHSKMEVTIIFFCVLHTKNKFTYITKLILLMDILAHMIL